MDVTQMSRIDRSIEITAPPQTVWRALTTAADLGAWFKVKIEGDIAAGKDVWMDSTHPDYPGLRWQVWFIELTPPTRFVWEWHPGAADSSVDYSPEPRTRVTFTLEPTARGTRVTVSETGFELIPLSRREKAFTDNTGGWVEVVEWIKQYVEKKH